MHIDLNMEKRNHGIDLLKFIAAIMITNSHYVPLYEGHNISFATLGVQGNALFFFVSGFFLNNIENSDGYHVRFDDWIRKKIFRLWPTLIVFFVFANLIFSKEINWYDFLMAGEFWFVRCFVVSFSIIYFLIRYLKKYLIHLLVSSVLIIWLYIFLSPKVNSSIYHEFHYTIYFSSMLLGVCIGIFKERIKIRNFYFDTVFCMLSFLLYFAIMYFGKGKMDHWYYIQLIAVVPLLSFLYFSYKVVSYTWVAKLASFRIWPFIYVISSLTYEIYIVQFNLITNSFNLYYPLNTLIVFCIIIFSAYLLRILTNFFVLLFSKRDWSLKEIIRL